MDDFYLSKIYKKIIFGMMDTYYFNLRIYNNEKKKFYSILELIKISFIDFFSNHDFLRSLLKISIFL